MTFITPDVAGDLLGVTPNTIRKAVKAGDLKAYRDANSPRGRISITESDLDTFSKARG